RRVPKAIEAIHGSDPDRAFTILENGAHSVAGQAFVSRKNVGHSAVHMHEAATGGGYPQPAIAIAEHPVGLAPVHRPRELKRDDRLSFGHSPHAPGKGEQQRTVTILGESADVILFTLQRVECRYSRLPSPDSVGHSDPDIVRAVYE